MLKPMHHRQFRASALGVWRKPLIKAAQVIFILAFLAAQLGWTPSAAAVGVGQPIHPSGLSGLSAAGSRSA